jgi:hypothetical protein
MSLLSRGDIIHSIRILLFIAESFPRAHPLFVRPTFPPQFLAMIHDNLSEVEFVLLALKFLTIRTAIKKEAILYLNSGLLQFLVDVANQSYDYARWVCWIAGNAIDVVPGCVENCNELGLFDYIERIILEGNYDAKSAASIAFVRIVNHGGDLIEEERIMKLLMEVMELLASGSPRTVSIILGCALNVASHGDKYPSRIFLDAIIDGGHIEELHAIADGESEICARLAEELCKLL